MAKKRLCLSVLLAFAAGCGREGDIPFPAATGPEYTFLVLADTHYGLSQWDDNEAANKAAIDRMNLLPGTPYPSEAGGGAVGAPLAAIVAGDLTDTGEFLNWHGYWIFGRHDGFKRDYGQRGEGRIHCPVIAGYGNHDITEQRTAVADALRARNGRWSGANLSGDHLHVSWDWGSVHFVHLNLYPGGPGDARDSLGFLKDDLEQQVGESRRPVVIFHHYGFDPFSFEERWWTEQERAAYFNVIEPYHVLAIFNGHLHDQGHRVWQGIDAYTAGKAGDGCFLVVHMLPDKMVVAGRTSQGWGASWTQSLQP